MKKVTREDIESRVEDAGKLLKERTPTLPVQPDVLLQVADESKLPIGSADLARDPVARTVFIVAFAPQATVERQAGIDAICRLFQHSEAAAA
ncbi:MAG: hypothetical protein JWM46_592 [Candidatus Kaiserbacteria bacterium]|nr:hypothetical protein [Candidatus Kaiserbacteria bacterium]